MRFFDDGFNPKFVFHSPVHRSELDSLGVLPPSRFAAHAERAVAAYCRGTLDSYAVSEMRFQFLTPLAAPTTIRIDLWVDELGDDTCAYGFLFSSEDGLTPYARGARTIRNTAASWTLPFRTRHAALLRDLPAYA